MGRGRGAGVYTAWPSAGLGLTRVPGSLLLLLPHCTGLQEMEQC